DGANQPTSCAAQGRLASRINPDIDGFDGIRSGALGTSLGGQMRRDKTRRQDLKTETIQPEDFNERVTVFLDSEGCSVERTLHEMTAVEVLASIEWHTDEALRLQEESAPYVEIANASAAGMLDPNIRRGARQTANDSIKRTAVALEKAAR